MFVSALGDSNMQILGNHSGKWELRRLAFLPQSPKIFSHQMAAVIYHSYIGNKQSGLKCLSYPLTFLEV